MSLHDEPTMQLVSKEGGASYYEAPKVQTLYPQTLTIPNACIQDFCTVLLFSCATRSQSVLTTIGRKNYATMSTALWATVLRCLRRTGVADALLPIIRHLKWLTKILYESMQKLHATAMQLFFFGFQCSYSL